MLSCNAFKYLVGCMDRAVHDTSCGVRDLRNRGRSDFITDNSKLRRGIHQDVDDLEAVRRHFGIDQIALIGHSYAGIIVILYAMKPHEVLARDDTALNSECPADG